ncbi:MAG: 30S ribosomal protein S4 [Fimbriimonadales bacterium]|nr:MAG: 30S ribosomal protein S4 [Fimbriimonadales bacterium]GIV07666.1 MAG: 30S ribosomal protein S4 [Fimbriimonadales bacterium]GIV10440.1 MAG: 30S ribosomal protein S4 [Fimbriimonadales bacterium]
MSVVWDSKCSMCRRAGVKLYLKGDRCYTKKCALERRNYPPGQHGPRTRDRKMSEYGEQLREKQKLRQMYQLREAQFRKYVEEAQRARGVTGEVLLRQLEMRLDNVVFRLGFANSRGQARQMVSHRFITVNGKRVNIPSYQVREGDVISIHESKRSTALAKEAFARAAEQTPPAWLAYEPNQLQGKVLHAPQADEIDTRIEVQKIIEFYSR